MEEHDDPYSMLRSVFDRVVEEEVEDNLIDRLVKKRLPLHDLKLRYIYAVIKSVSGNRAKAAKYLGMDINYLYKLVRIQGWNEFMGRPHARGSHDQN